MSIPTVDEGECEGEIEEEEVMEASTAVEIKGVDSEKVQVFPIYDIIPDVGYFASILFLRCSLIPYSMFMKVSDQETNRNHRKVDHIKQ